MISVKLGCVTGGSVSAHTRVSARSQMRNVSSAKEASGTTVGCSHLKIQKCKPSFSPQTDEVIGPILLTQHFSPSVISPCSTFVQSKEFSQGMYTTCSRTCSA